MNMFFRFFLLLLGCVFFVQVPASADHCDQDWELVMDKNGIKAYSRKVEGSGIFEFRAVMVVDARPEVVAEALRDIPAMPQWLPDCDNAYVINMEDRNNFTSYVSLDLPWPVKDRDLVMKTDTKYDFDHARAISDFVQYEEPDCPPTGSHIRIPELKGQYVFVYVTRERTGIVQTYRADIGGSLPEWLANFATKYNIYNTFMNLKDMFKKEKYLELAKTSPDRTLCENFQSNMEEVKSVLAARLREFIADEDFIAMIQNSRAIDDVLADGNGRISEILLYGWGSDESKKKAVRYVLEIYLSGRTCNEQTINTVLNDERLIDTILRGPGPGEKSSRQMIQAYLKTGREVAVGTEADNTDSH